MKDCGVFVCVIGIFVGVEMGKGVICITWSEDLQKQWLHNVFVSFKIHLGWNSRKPSKQPQPWAKFGVAYKKCKLTIPKFLW